ncbi:MAG: peptide ABC transporter substrate-binding protein [Candidatus Avispirillum sp.]
MKFTKVIAMLLCAVMVVAAFAGCTAKKPDTDTPVEDPTYADPFEGKTHAEVSDELYEKVLGEFSKYYEEALAAESISERFALMAVAEAKLLESGIMLPSTSHGGNYAISRVAPRTVNSTLWGNDSDRFHQAIIVDGDPILPAERDEMKAKWGELRGTGEYEAWAKKYLTDKGYTLTDVYTLGYTSDPTTWDALNTYRAADSEAIVNTYDGLMEYDIENEQQPALATGYTVSDDGLTYTFTIREGVNWVDSQGVTIEPVTADSFVAGMQHMMDAQGGLEYLIDGKIKNATQYMAGEVTDFSEVGVKAVDDYTLEYTLEEPCSYFTTMLGYGVFAPMSRAYFLANGGAFGVEEFAAASAADGYTYGTTPDKIAYCGPYLVKSYTQANSIVFEANPQYWNKDNINIKKLNWRYLDGSNPTESYDLMKDGTFSGAGLNTNAVAKAKEDGLFDKYAYVSETDATSFPVFFNLYRCQYANFNDETAAVTTLTENEQNKANIAMQNQHFRLALTMSLDRGAYNATTVGDELKLNSLVNSYTPGTFVTLPEDVTIEINGTATEFKAGTNYGVIMQAQIDADGIAIKAYDAEADAGNGSSAGYDGWYNVEEAKKELEAAIEELSADGMVIDADHPVKLELPYYDISEVYSNRANALKQSMEASLDGKVEIVLVKTGGSDALNWYYAGYYPETGDQMNYNLVDVCGWGPDYGDPSTYLDTMLPQGGGMAKNIGLY